MKHNQFDTLPENVINEHKHIIVIDSLSMIISEIEEYKKLLNKYEHNIGENLLKNVRKLKLRKSNDISNLIEINDLKKLTFKLAEYNFDKLDNTLSITMDVFHNNYLVTKFFSTKVRVN